MIVSSRLFLFLSAAVLLAIAPGPGMLYVLARSLAGGRREGVLSSLGTFVGGLVHVLAARETGDELPAEAVEAARNPFWQGIATEVLNPKTALFFLSFIPQFVNRDGGHVFAQFLALGAVSVSLNTSADLVVTWFAGPLGNRIRSSARFRRAQRTATGGVMLGLGAYLALSKAE